MGSQSQARRRSARARLLAAVLGLAFAAPAIALEPGERAPDFSATRLDKPGQVKLSDYRGKVVYLDFWASWCAPCLVALPLLDGLRKEFPADQFQVVGVNVDTEPDKARRVLQKRPVGYPSATDPKGSVPEHFGLETMPTSYLIDRKGVVRYVHPGFKSSDMDEIRSHVRDLVGESR